MISDRPGGPDSIAYERESDSGINESAPRLWALFLTPEKKERK